VVQTEDEHERLRGEISRLQRQLAQQQANTRRAWQAAGRFQAVAELVVDVPRLLQGPLGSLGFPQNCLEQVAGHLGLGRVALFAADAVRGGLTPVAGVGGPMAPIVWPDPVPDMAVLGIEPEGPFEQALRAAAGAAGVWAYDRDSAVGVLVAEHAGSVTSPDDLMVLRSVLRLHAQSRTRLAAETARQQGLAGARALNRLASSFIHVEAERLEGTLAAGLGEVADLLGADRGCLYQIDLATGVIRLACPPQGRQAPPNPLPAEVPLADLTSLINHLRMQERVEVHPGDPAGLTALPLLGVARGELARRRALFLPIVVRQNLDGFLAFLLPIDEPRLVEDPLLRTIVSVFASALAAHRDRQERIALNSQIQQAQKLDSLGVLAGGIAHDFNNILTPLFAGIELALLMCRDRPEVQSPLQGALMACERARKLVQQILLFSRKNPVERRPVSLERLLREAGELLRASMPPTIVLDVGVQPPPSGRPLTTIGDISQLVQVVVNLGTNAWHAIGEASGRVRLTADVVDLDEDASHALRPGTYAHIAVADTGRGIPAEIQPHIFDPFFTTKPPGKGTGMGLAVVHGIVNDHGGAIQFRTGPSGTTFHVYLPVSGSASATTEMTPLLGDFYGREGVLVVDDEPEIALRIQQLLDRLGYHVVTARSASDALAVLAESPTAFQLLITDFTMPEMTGLELARAAVQRVPTLRILLCTGYHEPLTPEVLSRAQIAGTIQKPFRYTALARQVRQTLDQGRT